MFMQEVYQKEAEAAGYDGSDLHQDTLTPYQRDILKKIRSIEANPITVAPVLTTRSSEQVLCPDSFPTPNQLCSPLPPPCPCANCSSA